MSALDPSRERKLTRSARAERNRILAIYEKAVGETCQMILMSGWNKLPAHQRRHAKAVAQAFEWTTDALKRALSETLPEGAESVPDEMKARHASAIESAVAKPDAQERSA